MCSTSAERTSTAQQQKKLHLVKAFLLEQFAINTFSFIKQSMTGLTSLLIFSAERLHLTPLAQALHLGLRQLLRKKSFLIITLGQMFLSKPLISSFASIATRLLRIGLLRANVQFVTTL
jgi:hypothetical protein